MLTAMRGAGPHCLAGTDRANSVDGMWVRPHAGAALWGLQVAWKTPVCTYAPSQASTWILSTSSCHSPKPQPTPTRPSLRTESQSARQQRKHLTETEEIAPRRETCTRTWRSLSGGALCPRAGEVLLGFCYGFPVAVGDGCGVSSQGEAD